MKFGYNWPICFWGDALKFQNIGDLGKSFKNDFDFLNVQLLIYSIGQLRIPL